MSTNSDTESILNPKWQMHLYLPISVLTSYRGHNVNLLLIIDKLTNIYLNSTFWLYVHAVTEYFKAQDSTWGLQITKNRGYDVRRTMLQYWITQHIHMNLRLPVYSRFSSSTGAYLFQWQSLDDLYLSNHFSIQIF